MEGWREGGRTGGRARECAIKLKETSKVNLTFHFDRCLCGKCQPMSSAEESMCCREVDPFWALVETLNPRPDVTCLTLHPGFEGCCLNPFVLQVAYLAFKQEHGPLQASTHEYVQLSTFQNNYKKILVYQVNRAQVTDSGVLKPAEPQNL